ncbi:MAG: hypothetical protein LBF51_08375 [Zoogloeaceae bacterium]|jgi:hypothetical protein|nr:hypothetical protein [Zoogloeaceae bacterium]
MTSSDDLARMEITRHSSEAGFFAAATLGVACTIETAGLAAQAVNSTD